MAIVSGQRGTGTQVAGLQKVDFASEILELEPDSAPLTVLTARLGSEPTHNPQFQWAESKLDSRFGAISNGAGYTNSATSLVTADGTKFAADQLVKVTRTGEVFRVVSVSTNTLTVVRGVGTAGTGVAIVDADELLIIGISQQEGADINPARSNNPTIASNYTQIFRTPWSSTETNRHTDLYVNSSDWAYAGKHAGIEHKKDQEYANWFGVKNKDTSGSHPRTSTGGVLSFITTNITATGGQMTESEFFGGFRGPARYGSKKWTLFCSLLFADVLNTYGTSKLQTIQADADTTYGLSVSRLVSPNGAVNVITHPLLEGAVYGGYGVLLDMSQVKRRVLANSEGSRDTHIVTNRQSPGVDGRTDEVITEAGLQFGLEARHAVYTGTSS